MDRDFIQGTKLFGVFQEWGGGEGENTNHEKTAITHSFKAKERGGGQAPMLTSWTLMVKR